MRADPDFYSKNKKADMRKVHLPALTEIHYRKNNYIFIIVPGKFFIVLQ
jgi:hypothetical protein